MTAFFKLFAGNDDKQTIEAVLPKLSASSQDEVRKYLEGSAKELPNSVKTEVSLAALKLGLV